MLKEFQSFRKFAVLERSYILMSDHTNLFSGMPKLKIYILSEKNTSTDLLSSKIVKKKMQTFQNIISNNRILTQNDDVAHFDW